GSFARLQPIDFVVAREEIARLVASESGYRVLFDKIADVVARFIAFDWATLFIYSPNRDYSRTVCWRGDEIEFLSRWFSTPDGYIDWLDQPETWVNDLRDYGPDLLKRQDMKAAIAAGMTALICVPIRSGGRIIGGFCLTSKQRGVYNADSRRT